MSYRNLGRIRRDIIEMMTSPIPEGSPIEDLCEGSPFCHCNPSTKRRVKGGTLHSQYKKGKRNGRTREANAAYMREYRRRKKEEASGNRAD